MFVYNALLLGLLLPGSISAAVLLGCRILGRRREEKRSRPWGQPVALGLGYMIGHAALLGWPRTPPLEPTHWLFFFALMAVVLGLVDAFWIAPLAARWVMRLLLSGFIVARLLVPWIHQQPEWGTIVVQLTAIMAVMLAFWINVSLLSKRIPGAPFPGAMMVVTLAESVALLFSHCIVQFQLGFVVWATLLGSLLGAGGDANLSLATGGLPVVVVLLSSLAIDGVYYSDLPKASALLLALAPAGLWVLQLGPVQRLSGTKMRVVAIAAVMIPAALAVWLAYTPE